ncbi:hypothetical protein FSARC_369 [Fusarium sarcochroum]|uniref:Aminoglycoside phosphotransferase domain-containing protein n=1 Tax=Fusarium sarcochroum TaxID=1208366 RepID=A0A8H4XGJ3_9HYPO|nr:hypothetical protein FSARC_369 [Fusarium sarcochroum]
MASTNDTQVNERAQSLIQKLRETPYACSSLRGLNGGSANYVYRGVLIHPIPSRDGSHPAKTVIVKYSLGHIPGNAGFALDLSRCAVETSMLDQLNDSSLASKSVMVPYTYYAHRDAQGIVQIHEDFPQSNDVSSLMRSSELNGPLTQSMLISRLKNLVTYGTLMSILQNFPDILQDNVEVLRKVKQRADSELEDLTSGKEGEHRGIIHGDCWMGNVLLSNTPPAGDRPLASADMILIDWELAQFGHRAYDLGHMIGDLYDTYHFHNYQNALLMIRGFMDGYGEIDDDLAFRTAIHAGVQLLGWYNRRAPHAPILVSTYSIGAVVQVL